MRLRYNKFKKFGDKLFKAYYHLEDKDFTVLDQLIDKAQNSDEDPCSDCDFSFEYNLDKKDGTLIVTINAVDYKRAQELAFAVWFLLNIFYLLRLDIENKEQVDDSYSTHASEFLENLDSHLKHYILNYLSEMEIHIMKSMSGSYFKDINRGEELIQGLAMRYYGLKDFLSLFNIVVDSDTMKRGEYILENESVHEFAIWFASIYKNESDYKAIYYNLISNNLHEEPKVFTTHNDCNQYIISCIKKYRNEYEEWQKKNYLQRKELSYRSVLDYVRGIFSLELVFTIYDRLFNNEGMEKMFMAMNSDTSDTHLNKEIVEAVKAYPDPHFAEQVVMHYNKYKMYCSQHCADFPFVDPVAEPKQQQVLQSNQTAAPGQRSIKARLGYLLETSLLKDDVSALSDCFYKVLMDPDRDASTIKGDLIYYLSKESEEEEGHCGVHWPGSRESLAFFIQKVLPGKERGFWKNAYKVFMVKQNGKWGETSSLNTIGPREWVKIEKECENMELYFNNWMNRRPELKGQWEIGDWRKSKGKRKKS